MLKKKWFGAVLNVIAWILYFTLPHLMRPAQDVQWHRGTQHPLGPSSLMPPDDSYWLLFSALQNLLLVPLFYLNIHYFLPQLTRRRKYGLLAMTQAGALLLHYGFTRLVTELLTKGATFRPPLFMSVMSYVLVFSIAYGLFSFRESRRVEALQKEREMETVKAELQFLRWQISPHFLFNALNNMVSMARKKSDLLEPALIHLSALMRYTLYQTEGSRISLYKESEYLKSFIHLQSLRYSNVQIESDINVPEYDALHIEPMLLIPFVENAFKHGIDLIENPQIRIRLTVDGHRLCFDVANKYLPGSHGNKDDAHGIGLANVRKRLNFLYEDRHSLETNINGWYTVHLKVELA